MHCIYCHLHILEKNEICGHPITIVSQGVAHFLCHSNYQSKIRIFKNLQLKNLTLSELDQIIELATLEKNERTITNEESVTLF